MTEATYTHDIGAKGERNTRVMLSGDLKIHSTSTGVLQVKIYSLPRGARVNISVEIQQELEVKEEGEVHCLHATTRMESMGSHTLNTMSGDHAGMLIARSALRLAHGFLAQEGAKDALWDVLWYTLQEDKQLRDNLSKVFPRWVENLELEDDKVCLADIRKG